VFQLRNWSAIYSAPGGANGSEPNCNGPSF